MNTVFNLSGDAGRKCAIDIAGSPHQAMMRTSAYTVKVPYSSLAHTLHSIGKRGGKVVNVRMLSTPMPGVDDIPVASGFLIPLEDMEVAPSPQPPTETVEPPQPESRRQQQKSKKR
jgi:phycocyanin-associated, rod